MTDYEKQNNEQPINEKSVEEIDTDYITGGAQVVTPEETNGLTPTRHTQECNCGKFTPNKSGICGEKICENCKHAKKLNDDSTTTFCAVQPLLPHFS